VGKDFKDLTVEDMNDMKIEFAPGAFDDFEGSQEELDELINEISQLIKSGEILEKSRELDMEELREQDPEFYEKLVSKLDNTSSNQRNIH
jgi:hypothetical protein